MVGARDCQNLPAAPPTSPAAVVSTAVARTADLPASSPPAECPIFEIAAAASFFIEDSERFIAGDLTEAGLLVHLDRRVPMVLPAPTKSFAEALLSTAAVSPERAFWAIHPGGRAILDSLQRTCGLSDEQMRHSR